MKSDYKEINAKITALALIQKTNFEKAAHYIIYQYRVNKLSFNTIMRRHGIK